MRYISYSLLILWVLFGSSVRADSSIHHDIYVMELNPAEHTIRVKDEITIPADRLSPEVHFLLHGELMVTESSISYRRQREAAAEDFGLNPEDFEAPMDIPVFHYIIEVPDPGHELTFTFYYEGTIYHPIEEMSEEYARSFSVSPGIISAEGVYLSGSSIWVPWFNDDLVTFNLDVTVDAAWDVISQGTRAVHEVVNGKKRVRWESPQPVDEPFLIAGPFTEYDRNAGAVTAMVFLREADDAATLAEKYLEATAQYLEMYRELIGPYPYTKFALVENFWETGYGMPSFTLLGPKIIRFPFILHSSYPHEILHNWWGNGVFVDYDKGNWCEGLTAYMADHLIKEQRGQAVEYRRSTLQKYADYVKESNDFPLIEFRSRHNASTEAIGYGKSLMFFHMLRQEVGDELFARGMRQFYREQKFKKATFDDIRTAFESLTGIDLKPFFEQWTTRTGAPNLALSDVTVTPTGDKHQLTFQLRQTQAGDPFPMRVPVAIYFASQPEPEIQHVPLTFKSQFYQFEFDQAPVRIDVDPQFDVFRAVDPHEVPPALSKIFGDDEVLMVLPRNSALVEAYQQLARTWNKPVVYADELEHIPADKPVWILGWDNPHRSIITNGISDYDAVIGESQVRFGKTVLTRENNSFVVVARHPQNVEHVVVWLATDNPAAIPGLARKLPHYGKYSYLVFEGDEPTNIAKGQWEVVHSPLSVTLGQMTVEPKLPERQALAELPPVFSADRMMADIQFLASAELQGRGFGSAGLDRAAEYIQQQFENAGLQVIVQEWSDQGGLDNQTATLKNIIGIIPGTHSGWEQQSVVISAHYDHLGLGWPDVRQGNEGKIHYGADDNASGVAVLLELARTWGTKLQPSRTIILAAFTAEEAGRRGSKYYVDHFEPYPADQVMANINLDTVGRLGDGKIQVIGGSTASEWKHVAMGVSFVTGIPSEMVTQDLDASDQVSFIEKGIPAIQLFTGAHLDYHRPSDTPDRIDADGLVKVAMFTREAALYLAEREQPMRFTGSPDKEPPPVMEGTRRATTGSMPDFSYSGEGVRLAEVPADSPAAKAGLQPGDVLIRVNETPIPNLQAYTNVLKAHQPGDEVLVTFQRDGNEKSAKLVLGAR